MKKILMAVLAMFACATVANAKTSGIQDVQPKGGFNMGVMLGVPPATDDHVDAKFAMTSVDFNWTVASGFINAKKFGQNGAVDLGLYYGFAPYETTDDYDFTQHCILFRSAFHFEFVEKLDTYAGIFGGANVWAGDADTDNKACYGLFTGCKYYFTDHFGVKAEFGYDMYKDHNYPGAALGIALKF